MTTPPFIRNAITSMFIFKVVVNEWMQMRDKLLGWIPKDFTKCLSTIFKEKYQFLYINLDQYKVYWNFRRINI